MTRPFSAVSKKGFSIKNIKAKAKISLATASVITAASIIGISNSITGIASALSISSIYVNQGPAAGNTEVTIKGEGFLKTIEEKDEVVDVAITTGNHIDETTIIAITKMNKIYSFGNNKYGSAGTGEKCMIPVVESSSDNSCYYNEPQDITANFSEDKIIDVESPKEDQFMALSESGRVYVWGKGANEYDDGTTTEDYYVPTIIKSLQDRKINKIEVEAKQEANYRDVLLYTDTSIIYIYYNVFPQGRTELSELVFSNVTNKVPVSDYNVSLAMMIVNEKLLRIDTNQCRPLDLNLESNPFPECAKLVDITDALPTAPKELYENVILGTNGNLYMPGEDVNYDNFYFEDVSKAFNLPKIKSMPSGDENLLLTEDSRILVYNYELGKFYYDNLPKIKYLDVSISMITYTPQDSPDTICSYNIEELGPRKELDQNRPTCVKIPLQSTTKTVPAISKVSFGNVMTSNFRIVDNNTIIAYTPAHPAGKVDVKLYPVDSDKDTVILPQSYEYLDDNSTGNLNPGEQVVPSAPNTGVRKH